MNRSTTTLLLALLTTGLAGCPRPAPAPAGPPPAAPAPVDPLSLINSAGEGAAAVVLIDPARWQAAARKLAPVMRPLGQPRLDAALTAPGLWQALFRLLGNSDLAPRVEGWDPGRPLVAGLFRTSVDDAVLAARALIPASMAPHVAGVRHRLLVPASDAGLLARNLEQSLTRAGLVRERASLDLGGRQVQVLEVKALGGLLALIPEGRQLRLEALVGDSRGVSAVRQGQHWWAAELRRLPDRRRRSPQQASPAERFAAGVAGFAVVHLRPARLRDLASVFGTRMVHGALKSAAPERRSMLLAQGLAAVAQSYLLMSPEGVEAADLALSLEADSALRLTGVASLTDRGRSVWAAGATDRGAGALQPRPGDHLLRLWTGLDFKALLERAHPPQRLLRAGSWRRIVSALRECGLLCGVHYALSQPVGFARLALGNTPGFLRNYLARSLALVLESVDRHNRQQPLRGAAAIRLPASSGGVQLRLAMVLLERLMARNGLRLQLQAAAPGWQTLLAGMHMNPVGAFVPLPAAEAAAELDPARLALALPAGQSGAAAVLKRLGPVRGRSLLSGPTTVSQLVLSLAPGKAEDFARAPDFSASAWKAPRPGPSAVKGRRCLEQVTATMLDSFEALAATHPDRRGALLRAGMERARAPLACAANQPETRQQALRIQALMGRYIVESLAAEPPPGAAPAARPPGHSTTPPATPPEPPPTAAGTDGRSRPPRRPPRQLRVAAEATPTRLQLGAGKPTVQGALEPAAAQRVIRYRLPTIRSCFERMLSSRKARHGDRWTLRLVVGEDGAVWEAYLRGRKHHSPVLESCVIRLAKGWRFPRPQGMGKVVVSAPLVFRRVK